MIGRVSDDCCASVQQISRAHACDPQLRDRETTSSENHFIVQTSDSMPYFEAYEPKGISKRKDCGGGGGWKQSFEALALISSG